MNTVSLNVIQTAMIKEFQCSGCVAGPNPEECSSFKPAGNNGSFYCKGWVSGTMMFPVGMIALGLPTGFNKIGSMIDKSDLSDYIQMYESVNNIPQRPVGPTNIFSGFWNRLNLPVWAMERDGYFLLKTMLHDAMSCG